MKKIVLASLALALGWSGTAFAQTEVDALRYTQLGVTGSARVQGLGGAQTALGADISNLSSNPAGIGLFRRSEFSFTPALQFNTTDTDINGARQSDERNLLTIPQAGIILSNRKGDEDASDWRGLNFGINLTRLNNFNQRISYNNTIDLDERFEQGLYGNTIVDYFADQANNRALSGGQTLRQSLDAEFGEEVSIEGLAYSTYLIDIFEDAQGQYAEPLYSLGDIAQSEVIERRGSQNQIDIGVGTSYRDRIYLGASVGIVTTNLTQESTFLESGNYVASFDEDGNPVREGNYSLELFDQFTTRGAGVNLKVGIIARPIDALRLGASIQTPTAYTLTDTYQRSLYSTTLNPDTGVPEDNSASEVPGDFSYSLTTPFKATGGVAVFLGKYGFITGDVEYVNYAGTRFSADDTYGNGSGNMFTNLNNSISSMYQSAMSYRIGAEGRYESFRVRAGYAHSGDPYASSELDGAINSVSLGAGIRLQNYYADLAYVRSTSDSRYSPYQFGDGTEPVVGISNTQNSVLLTVGYNF
ncbi:OmpP1/FadL family transporter [Pontibacter toksunensis]|uniref:OmpP1/FadL family transporter n=1 Tax=Pontibacter toksunensis TaxID=1332631 RepID=A0ABW6BQ61_9BACT